MVKRRALRDKMASDQAAVAVGAHDALTALLIDRQGFDAVWVSGLAVATSVHALPDINLTSLTETLDAAIRCSSSAGVEKVLSATDTPPAMLMPKTADRYSGRLTIRMPTRLSLPTPLAIRALATSTDLSHSVA